MAHANRPNSFVANPNLVHTIDLKQTPKEGGRLEVKMTKLQPVEGYEPAQPVHRPVIITPENRSKAAKAAEEYLALQAQIQQATQTFHSLLGKDIDHVASLIGERLANKEQGSKPRQDELQVALSGPKGAALQTILDEFGYKGSWDPARIGNHYDSLLCSQEATYWHPTDANLDLLVAKLKNDPHYDEVKQTREISAFLVDHYDEFKRLFRT